MGMRQLQSLCPAGLAVVEVTAPGGACLMSGGKGGTHQAFADLEAGKAMKILLDAQTNQQ